MKKQKRKIKLYYQNPSAILNVPTKKDFTQWVKLAMEEHNAEITIRLVEEDESSHLNQHYRNKSGPTNVLSFYYSANPDENCLVGDLIFCVPIVLKEAKEQNKLPYHHWAHLTLHGALHLLGYDHITNDEAEEMENLEIELLKQLNIANPYQSR